MGHKLFLGIAPALILAAVAAPAGQQVQPTPQIQHETRTVNIEVPVRVFQGEAFLDRLTIADFEIFEDGRPQTLDAVYLVKKAGIERREGAQPGTPDTSRHFYLFFELTEYDLRLREALDYFVGNVLAPGDELVFVTPLKTYRMKSDSLKDGGRNKVLDRLLGLLRKDVLMGNAEYMDVVDEMRGLAAAIGSSAGGGEAPVENSLVFGESNFESQRSVEEQLQRYADCLSRLESLRRMDQAQVDGLANYLRNQSGQKELFLFYQREFIPKIDDNVLNLLMSEYNERPDITAAITSLFGIYKRDLTIDLDVVRREYADAGAAIHFLYLTRPAPKVRGLKMEEQSEDIFGPFREMALATGGLIASTANISAAMKSAVAASENYYLLYYTPKDYKADGTFHTLEVRVKADGCRTSHKLGYIAD